MSASPSRYKTNPEAIYDMNGKERSMPAKKICSVFIVAQFYIKAKHIYSTEINFQKRGNVILCKYDE